MSLRCPRRPTISAAVVLGEFGDRIAAGPERAAKARARDPNNSPQAAANVLYWFERELRQYTRTELDLEALAVHADRVVLAGGRDSTKQITYQPNTVLAATIGKTIVDLPGGHVGLITLPPNSPAHCSTCSGRPGPRGEQLLPPWCCPTPPRSTSASPCSTPSA